MTDRPAMELVRRALRGDESSFERLVHNVEPSLARWVNAHLWARADVGVDDVLNEARLYIFQRLTLYDPTYPFGVFALALTRNVFKRLLRKRGKEIPWNESWPVDLESISSDTSGDPLPCSSPEDSSTPSQHFLEVFELFARHGGYPHQQIAFGFSVMLFGRDRRPKGHPKAALRTVSKVPVSGDPARVVEEIGPRELGEACEQMFSEIREELRLGRGYTDRVQEPLRARLRLTGAALFADDPTSRRLFAGLLDRPVARHRLDEYFGSDARRSVADWTRTVKHHVRRALEDGTFSGPLHAIKPPATAELDGIGGIAGRRSRDHQEGKRG